MTTRPTIVVCEGDQTGQELLDQALRALESSVLGFELEFLRYDLSLRSREATNNGVIHEAAAKMRETGLGLKATTDTPSVAAVGATLGDATSTSSHYLLR